MRVPLVARNKMRRSYFRYPPSLPVSRNISGGKQVIKSLPTRVVAVVFVCSNKSRQPFNSHAKCTVRVSTGFTSLLFAVGTSIVATVSKKLTRITSIDNDICHYRL